MNNIPAEALDHPCADCNADISFFPGSHQLTIWHDDSCPYYNGVIA